MALDSHGRIAAAGSADVGGYQRFAVARFDDGGRPDVAFAGDGRATYDLTGQLTRDVAADVATDSSDRLVLVGQVATGTRPLAAVVRLLSDGSPDAGFDQDGQVILPLPDAGANGVALDPSGRILVVGNFAATEHWNAFLARLLPDGTLDTPFGSQGIVRESFLAEAATGTAVASDSAGRYVIAGGVASPQNGAFGLARYLGVGSASKARRCRGRRATVVGTERPDRLRGTSGRDVILARGGNDVVRARGGNDLVCAGAGNDLARGEGGRDRLFGQAGRDQLLGGRGGDLLVGGAGKDRLRGGAGLDVQRR